MVGYALRFISGDDGLSPRTTLRLWRRNALASSRQRRQEPLEAPAEEGWGLGLGEGAGAFEDVEVGFGLRCRKSVEPEICLLDRRELRLPPPGEPDGGAQPGELPGDVERE